MAVMVMHLLVVVVVAVLQDGVSGFMPHLSPFFFLCNYHGNVQDLGFETGEITLSVSIVGNPEFYIPGQFYEGEGFCLFICFWLWVRWIEAPCQFYEGEIFYCILDKFRFDFFYFFLALQYRLWWPVADLVVSLMFSVNFDLFMTLKWVISRVNIDNRYKTELIASDVSCHHKLIFHWPYSEPDIQSKLWWLAYSWPCQSDVWQCVPDLAVGLNLTTSL